MHEDSIVQSLVDGVAAAVGERSGSVHHVDVAIGEPAGVDCGLLATAYEVFRPRLAAGDEILLQRIEFELSALGSQLSGPPTPGRWWARPPTADGRQPNRR